MCIRDRDTPVAFYVTDGAITSSEIWAAGSLYGFRRQVHFYACCQPDIAAKLSGLINARRPLLLISDATFEEMPRFLEKNKFKSTLLQQRTGIIAPEWILTSFIRHGSTDIPRRKNLSVFYIP